MMSSKLSYNHMNQSVVVRGKIYMSKGHGEHDRIDSYIYVY